MLKIDGNDVKIVKIDGAEVNVVNIDGEEAFYKCEARDGQLLDNPSFDCGDERWSFDPLYPATITDNGDGSVHLKSDSNFGSLVPEIPVFESNTYTITCVVRNLVGTGKMSIRNTSDVWFNSVDITADGTYSFDYTGNIKEIHCGAKSDPTYEADYDEITLVIKP